MPILIRTLLLLFLLPSCALERGTSFAPTPAEARLIELMGKRLAIANEVAWIKYSSQLPVRDPKREAEVLGQLASLAGRSGLDAAATTEFFGAQIRASRLQQEDDIRRWSAGAALPVQVPQSLRDDIRLKIDAIDRALITALAGLGSPRAGLAAFANGAFRGGGVCRAAARAASRPLP